MRLFILLENGQPVGHPIVDNNFRQAFPEVNIEDLPNWVANFERVPKPDIGVYEIYEETTYEWDNDIVKDFHHIRLMTQEEKLEKQNLIKNNWNTAYGFPSWIFDEESCSFKPPTPHPQDGNFYVWDETTTSWVIQN